MTYRHSLSLDNYLFSSILRIFRSYNTWNEYIGGILLSGRSRLCIDNIKIAYSSKEIESVKSNIDSLSSERFERMHRLQLLNQEKSLDFIYYRLDYEDMFL